MTDTPTIQTKGLTRAFNSLTAVDALDLSVFPGEMFGIVGPDGAGKTTLIRMLCGVLAPTSGTARVLGFDLGQESDSIKKNIGYLSQRFSLYGDLTVDENIEFFAEINSVKDYKPMREELLEFTRLAAFRGRLAERLSGGMKQKLGLACTLIHAPRLLFLDEPTTGVDPVSRRDFWKILQSLLERGITIVMSTPYLDEAERCTRVALLHHGKVMDVDTPSNLLRHVSGKAIEIVCRPSRVAYAVLRKKFPEVQAFGDRLNILVKDVDTDRREIEKTLLAEKVSIESIRSVRPSLENVFISLLSSPNLHEA